MRGMIVGMAARWVDEMPPVTDDVACGADGSLTHRVHWQPGGGLSFLDHDGLDEELALVALGSEPSPGCVDVAVAADRLRGHAVTVQSWLPSDELRRAAGTPPVTREEIRRGSEEFLEKMKRGAGGGAMGLVKKSQALTFAPGGFRSIEDHFALLAIPPRLADRLAVDCLQTIEDLLMQDVAAPPRRPVTAPPATPPALAPTDFERARHALDAAMHSWARVAAIATAPFLSGRSWTPRAVDVHGAIDGLLDGRYQIQVLRAWGERPTVVGHADGRFTRLGLWLGESYPFEVLRRGAAVVDGAMVLSARPVPEVDPSRLAAQIVAWRWRPGLADGELEAVVEDAWLVGRAWHGWTLERARDRPPAPLHRDSR